MKKNEGRNIIADIAKGNIEKSCYNNTVSTYSTLEYNRLTEDILKLQNIAVIIKNLSKKHERSPDKLIRFYLNDLKNVFGFTNEKIARDSNISRGYFQELLSGKKYASRDTIISLGFGFELNLDEINLLLKKAGYNELYMRNSRDAIIAKCRHDNISIIDTNQILDNCGFDILGK